MWDHRSEDEKQQDETANEHVDERMKVNGRQAVMRFTKHHPAPVIDEPDEDDSNDQQKEDHWNTVAICESCGRDRELTYEGPERRPAGDREYADDVEHCCGRDDLEGSGNASNEFGVIRQTQISGREKQHEFCDCIIDHV